ncbi:hypothetical protein [Chamaesiphon sp. OTE_75_metabat_556]|uniref:hypothetical protein n=1 Tax=Chamaesiphon sp. OTE_75_metabat_556 TaxID=2964692 RepID=UPI00286B5FBF|nr:hypothetical protein [Chamaesiphon sp. OTE_75_metabat_556]
MKSNYPESKLAPLTKIAIQFLKGAALGLIFVTIAYLYFTYFTPGIAPIQIAISVVFITLCGTLSVIWGNKVVDTLWKILESSPF